MHPDATSRPGDKVTDDESATRARTGGQATSGQAGSALTPRRLVVELNRVAAEELSELVTEEETNKTTIVNRAIQLYAMLSKLDRAGGKIVLQEPGEVPERLRFL